MEIQEIGTYDNTKPLHEQDEAVQEYCQQLMQTGCQGCMEEMCGQNVRNQEVKRPLEQYWYDTDKGVKITAAHTYTYPATHAKAFQRSTNYLMEDYHEL